MGAKVITLFIFFTSRSAWGWQRAQLGGVGSAFSCCIPRVGIFPWEPHTGPMSPRSPLKLPTPSLLWLRKSFIYTHLAACLLPN